MDTESVMDLEYLALIVALDAIGWEVTEVNPAALMQLEADEREMSAYG